MSVIRVISGYLWYSEDDGKGGEGDEYRLLTGVTVITVVVQLKPVFSALNRLKHV